MRNLYKTAALLLAGCAAAGSAFAIDLGNGFRLDGEVVSGLRIATQDESVDVTPKHDDEGNPRFRLAAVYESSIHGLKGRLQYQMQDDPEALPLDGFAFGWLKFGQYASLYAGIIDDSHFGTGGVIDKNLDAVTGVKLLITPVPTLALGFAIPVTEKTIGNTFRNLVFGAKYSTKVITLSAALKIGGVEQGTPLDIEDANSTDNPEYSAIADLSAFEMLFDVNSAPFPGFVIDVSGYIGTSDGATVDYGVTNALGNKLLASDALGYAGVRIAPKVSYRAQFISAYLQGDFRIDNDHTDGLYAKGYVVADGDPRINLETEVRYLSRLFEPYLRIGVNNVAWFQGSGMYLRVGTPINIGRGVGFEFWNNIDRIGATEGEGGGIRNTVQLNFSFTF